MGIFNRTKTPPPPASEASHDQAHLPKESTTTNPIVNNHTGTTYTPTTEMPAPEYTQHPQQPIQHQDGINTAPPPGAHEPHFNEKSAALNSQQTGYSSDPNLLHNNTHQQQQVYPDATSQQYSQSQIHVQQAPIQQQQQYSTTDFHAHDKTQPMTNGQQQAQHNGNAPFQQTGRNEYNSARPLHSLQARAEVVDCPHCGVRELTRTVYASGGTTHALAALLCFCFCLGCIPYIGHWVKDCEHYCGNCNQLLAIWHRSGDTEVIQRRQGQQQNGKAGAGMQQKPGGPGAAVQGQNGVGH